MTDRTFPELLQCEDLLDQPEELYLRQVTAKHCDGNMVFASAFQVPSKRKGATESPEDRADRYKLSGARSLKQTPQGAYAERQQVRASEGTWGVSVSEVGDAGSRLIDDTGCPTAAGETLPTGHTYLDQRVVDDQDFLDQLRMTLAGAATRRRRLHPPAD